MSSTYIPAALRRLVRERASGCCEYCLMPEQLSLITYAIDHVIAEKHGGRTDADNLAFSCLLCNQYKGSDIASLDPDTNQISALYNPRTDRWTEHFSLHKANFLPLTAKGRVTVNLLKLNWLERIEERLWLAEVELLKLPDQ
ncbi:MAG: HNH endonuclease signature motif containing protein [Phormidesmis sp.]